MHMMGLYGLKWPAEWSRTRPVEPVTPGESRVTLGNTGLDAATAGRILRDRGKPAPACPEVTREKGEFGSAQ